MTIDDKLQHVRSVFLDEDDEETRLDNEAKIASWEQTLVESETFIDWRSHDVTRKIAKQAKDTYRSLAAQLSYNRSLTEEERKSMWAKQDAMLWLLSLTEQDARASLEQVHKEIERAFNAT